MKTGKRIINAAIACLCAITSAAMAQPEAHDTLIHRKLDHAISLGLQPGYIFPSNDFFREANASGTLIRSTFAAHLKYGFRFGPDTEYGKIYPYAIQGIGVGYNSFPSVAEMGNPIALYVFQTSRVATLTKTLSLDYEWNFGASFGWKPYDEETNPTNTVVGSKINAYINLGFLLNWQVTPALGLKAGIGLSHYSNGNTSYPNGGVNTLGAQIGMTWYPSATHEATLPSLAGHFSPYVSYDLILYGATRKRGITWPDGTAMMVPGAFAVGGLNFNPMYNFSPYFRAGLSLDAQFDESANISEHIANTYPPASPDEMRFHRPPFKEQFSLGLSARAEIVMPIFSINLGIGKNFLCDGPDTEDFYQIFALKTHLTRSLFLHVGYQLYRFKDPNNLMLGIGYRFNAGKW